MNRGQKLLSVIGIILVAACTSEKLKVEDAAIESAKHSFQLELKEEIAKEVTGKVHLQATTVDILTKKTEFSVAKSEINGDHATVDIRAETIPKKVKNSLVEIIARLEPQKERNLNVPDAIGLIFQQLGLSSDERSTLIYRVNLKKEGSWKVQEPQNK